MKTKQIKVGLMVWKAMKIFVTTTSLLMMLMGCSKGDDSVSQINEPTEKTGNSKNTVTTDKDIGVTVTLKTMVPESPAVLTFGQDVEVTYDYEVTRSDGARIWLFPITNGANTPKYKYELSPKYTGKGTKTVKFSVIEGDSVVVDQLKIQIGTGGYSLLGTIFWDPLEDIFEPVNYTFIN